MRRRWSRLALGALLAALPLAVLAAEPPVFATLARWSLDGGKPALGVALAGALTDKQRSIVTGGFTTVSQLTIKLAPPGFDETRFPNEAQVDAPTLYRVRCSVKFDAWEETYDVARLDDTPGATVVRDFAAYAKMCLTADIRPERLEDQDVARRLARVGGTLLAYLVVRQTSVDEAQRIKDWLIQQQSGVMQTLFSHMLGQLTLNQTVKVRIAVPPRPPELDERAGAEEAPPAGRPAPERRG